MAVTLDETFKHIRNYPNVKLPWRKRLTIVNLTLKKVAIAEKYIIKYLFIYSYILYIYNDLAFNCPEMMVPYMNLENSIKGPLETPHTSR